MSGVAGAYQQVDGEAATHVMSRCLAHRGPDDAGSYSFVDGRVSLHLAHRRLSVIDRERGRQPFLKHRLALSYNGEIYNYKGLQAELTSSGSIFTSSSDTEVVLEAWRRWGPGCLRKLRGMFAFAIFDERSGSLYLARDHLGVKPMHYIRRKDGVVFASEIKALTAAFGHELQIDPSGMVASILYNYVPDRRCTLDGVEKLQPGTFAEFQPDGGCHIRTYFDIAEVAAAAAAGPPIDLSEVIAESVNAHLAADVPISGLLSGSLGSGIVTVLAKRSNPGVDAYTAIFRPEDQRFAARPDSATQARKVARRHQIELHEVRIAPDVVELAPRLVDILDEPIGDPAAISTLLLCEAAQEAGAKVILSGLGADELFGGYGTCLAAGGPDLRRRFPGVARRAASAIGALRSRRVNAASDFSVGDEEETFRRRNSLHDPARLIELISPELWPDVDDLLGEHLEAYCDNFLTDHVNRVSLAHARMPLPGLHLAYTDRAAMAASIEVRVPFVDPVVFRAAFSLSGEHKVEMRSGERRTALKQAGRVWLPERAASRPGGASSAPLRTWVSRDLRDMVDDVLSAGELVTTGFIQDKALGTLISEDRAGREDNSTQIWQLLNLELWYRHVCEAGVGL
jgi:asparagine synthase (glutamine-hydrolysing)